MRFLFVVLLALAAGCERAAIPPTMAIQDPPLPLRMSLREYVQAKQANPRHQPRQKAFLDALHRARVDWEGRVAYVFEDSFYLDTLEGEQPAASVRVELMVDTGYYGIEPGDRVRVTGILDAHDRSSDATVRLATIRIIHEPDAPVERVDALETTWR